MEKETIEKAAGTHYPGGDVWTEEEAMIRRLAFKNGVKWQEERMFKLCEKWQEYVRINHHPEFSSISFRAYVESKKE